MNTRSLNRRALGAALVITSVTLGAGHAFASGENDCYVVHGRPGCSDAACAENICAHDPHCCATTWDAFCVGYANLNCAVRVGDLNGDDMINGLDLTRLLNRWGTPAGDVNGDFTTDGHDLALVLSRWMW